MQQEIAVSVMCITYNHEAYIRQCLDNFVNQKTNFKFEIIIHDDCSTDKTKQIIEEYVNKYPNMFVPMFETENQYSKGVQIVDDLMLPKAKGKYIAICEGDDYWCNENKLQMQYDFMESHPECSACFHNTTHHDLTGHEKDYNFNNFKEVHYLTPKEVIEMGRVHTSSYFVKKDVLKIPKFKKNYAFGDYVRITNYMLKGELAVLPQVMSVYNACNPGGLTYINYNVMTLENHLKEIQMIIDYLNEFNEFTNYKYKDLIQKEIDAHSYYIETKRSFARMKVCDKNEFYKLRNSLKKHPYHQIIKSKMKGFGKIKFFIKFNCPRWLWRVLVKLTKK